MKFNKEQRNALITQIKGRANKEIDLLKKEIKANYIPSNAYNLFKLQLKVVAEETEKLYSLHCNEDIRMDNDSIYYQHRRWDNDTITKALNYFKYSELEQLYKKIPTYDFSNLETDLILQELDKTCICIEDIIINALAKYKQESKD